MCDTAEFKNILYGEATDEIDTPRYRDSFMFNFRLDRVSFFKLNELIKSHRIFDSPKEGARIQAPSEFQLLVLLKYSGVMGTDASNRSASTFFRIGRGTAELFRRRALLAIISLESQALHWPDEVERVRIAN